jgi:hypothetical protein
MDQSVDVSWPQGSFNQGGIGVIVAATSGDGGTNFTQSTFVADVGNARRNGDELGYYHFNGPEGLSAVASAQYFWSVIRAYYRPGDIVALDVESSSGGAVPAVSPGWAAAFVTELARLMGVSTQALRCGIYGNRSTMGQAGWGALQALGCWLWLAAPGGYPENTPIGEWSHWTILQYSSAGGIDRDESQLTFAQIAGASTPQSEGDESMKVIVGGTEALVGEYESVVYTSPGSFSLAANTAAWGTTTGLTPDEVATVVGEARERRAQLVKDVAAAVIAGIPQATLTVDVKALAAAVVAAMPPEPTATVDAAALAASIETVLVAQLPAAVVKAEGTALSNG